MSVFYKWIPSGTACERCMQMGQEVHTSPPQKPHGTCVCTWIKINTNSQDKNNCSGEPIIQSSVPTKEGTATTKDGAVVRLNLTFRVTGICPDNTTMEIHLSVTVEGQAEVAKVHGRISDRLGQGAELREAVAPEIEDAQEKARAEAMQILISECPPCSPPAQS